MGGGVDALGQARHDSHARGTEVEAQLRRGLPSVTSRVARADDGGTAAGERRQIAKEEQHLGRPWIESQHPRVVDVSRDDHANSLLCAIVRPVLGRPPAQHLTPLGATVAHQQRSDQCVRFRVTEDDIDGFDRIVMGEQRPELAAREPIECGEGAHRAGSGEVGVVHAASPGAVCCSRTRSRSADSTASSPTTSGAVPARSAIVRATRRMRW